MNIPFHNETIKTDGLDLNELLIRRKASTYILKAAGDLLIVDRSKDPVNGSLIVAVLNSEFIVREYCHKGERIFLLSKDRKVKPLEIFPETDFLVWGVVTFIIKNAEKNNSAC